MWLSHDRWIQTKEHLPHLQVCLHEPTRYIVGNLKLCFRIWLSLDKITQVWSAPIITIRVTQIKSPRMPDNSTFMCIHSFSANVGGCGQPSLHRNPKSILPINRQHSSLGLFLPSFTIGSGGCTGINRLGMKKSILKRSRTAEEEGTTQLQALPKNCQTIFKRLETRNLLTRQEGENEDIKIYKYTQKIRLFGGNSVLCIYISVARQNSNWQSQ